MKKLALVLRLVASGILLQTLFFKFSAAPESVFIFETLHVEPYGRWFAGLSELVAVILLLRPATQAIGAFLGLNIMLGAILSHILFLGLVVQDDGGLLFTLAIIVFLGCAILLFLQQQQIKDLVKRIKG